MALQASQLMVKVGANTSQAAADLSSFTVNTGRNFATLADAIQAATARMDAAMAQAGLSADGWATRIRASQTTLKDGTTAWAATASASLAKVEQEPPKAATAFEQMAARIKNAIGGAFSGLGTVGSTLGGLASTVESTMGRVAKAVGIPAVVMGGVAGAVTTYSVKAAGDFQSLTELLVTQSGEQQSALDTVRKGLLDISSETGIMSNSLAQGSRQIEDVGYHGAAALNVAEAAAIGAKVGLADYGTTVDALTSLMVAYNRNSSEAMATMGQLNTAVGLSKSSMEQFAGAIGNALPIASALHIPLEQLLAIGAEATRMGLDASSAFTTMRFGLLNLATDATPKAQKALDAFGLSASQLSNVALSEGPIPALQLLKDRMDAAGLSARQETIAIQDIFGGVRGLQGVLPVIENLNQVIDMEHKIGDEAQGTANIFQSWETVQGTFNVQWDRFTAGIQRVGIEIGDLLLPKITPLIATFANDLPSAFQVVLPGLEGLASAFVSTMGAILSVVKTTAMAVYELFSYLNPFATHSPSLVSQVQDGTKQIIADFKTLESVNDIFYKIGGTVHGFEATLTSSLDAAKSAIGDFVSAASSGLATYNAESTASLDKALNLLGPNAVSTYNAAQTSVTNLSDQADKLNTVIQAQQDVVRVDQQNVDSATKAYDDMKDKVTAAQETLQGMNDAVQRAQDEAQAYQDSVNRQADVVANLKSQLDALKTSLDAAKTAQQDFLSAPLQGTGAFADQIESFKEQADKLQLAIDQAKANGGDTTALEAQLKAVNLQKQIVEDQQAVQLGPQEYAVKKLSDSLKPEKSLEEIQQGFASTQATITSLTPQVASLTTTYDAQNAVLTAMQQHYKELQSNVAHLQEAAKNYNDNTLTPLKNQENALQKVKDASDKLLTADNKRLSDEKTSYNDLLKVIDLYQKQIDDLVQKAQSMESKSKSGGAGALGPGGGMAANAQNIVQQLQDELNGNFFGSDWLNQRNQVLGNHMNGPETNIFDAWNTKIQSFASNLDSVAAKVKEKMGEIFFAMNSSPTPDESTHLIAPNNVLQTIETALEPAAEKIGEKVGAGIQVGFTRATKDLLVNTLTNIFSHPVDALMGLSGAGIGNMIGQSIGTAIGAALENGLGDELKKGIPNVLSDVWSTVKTSVGVANGTALGTIIGNSIVDGIKGGITAFADSLVASIGNFVQDKMIKPFKTLLGIASPSTVAAGWGEDLIQGFINGITGSAAAFLADIQAFVNDSVINPVEQLLGIKGKQPSTVFQDVGKSIIDGLTAGIANAETALLNTVRGVMNDLIGLVNQFINAWDAVQLPAVHIKAGPYSVDFGGGGFPHIDTIGLLQARATGGPVVPGQGYMVGENGPEPFFPTVPGTILPHNQVSSGAAIDYDRLADALSRRPMVLRIPGLEDVVVKMQTTAEQRGRL